MRIDIVSIEFWNGIAQRTRKPITTLRGVQLLLDEKCRVHIDGAGASQKIPLYA
jgi:hypothetical protein